MDFEGDPKAFGCAETISSGPESVLFEPDLIPFRPRIGSNQLKSSPNETDWDPDKIKLGLAKSLSVPNKINSNPKESIGVETKSIWALT